MARKKAQRPKIPPSRTKLIAAAGVFVVLVVWLGFGIRSVPDGAIGVLDSLFRGSRVLEPGVNLTVPGLERVQILDPYRRAGSLAYETPEGATLDITVDVAVHLTADGASELVSRSKGSGPIERLDASVDAILTGLLRDTAGKSSLPRLDEAFGDSVVAVLSRYGRVEGLPTISFAEESPVTAALREAELRHQVRDLRRDTKTKILIIGIDGADWQIADPLIERGLLPNLAALRKRGAWGNIKALTPILSPLIWTSVATGVTADRHGILDFLIRDPATGQHVPVNSRFRRVRALWNLFSDAGLTTDIVAWWATWPAEAINGHMISDRVAYSLFDFELPTGGVGATHPAAYFDEIRPKLITDDAITYDDVAPFVDITEDEFEAGRARVEVDRTKAYREPVNHLTKILSSTTNYHRIALDLLGREQADLTAVYYQAVDEVGHRFMHYVAPVLEGIAPDDTRRYGGAVDAIYVYQDKLLGELLSAADRDTTVIVLSDHGFLNDADRPRGETADIEGMPGRWHRQYGVLVIAGPDIVPQKLDTTSMLDITPTVLYLAGLPVPEDSDGRVLSEAIAPGFRERFPETRVATYEVSPFRIDAAQRSEAVAEAEAAIVENLRSLGYIGGGEATPGGEIASAAAGGVSGEPGGTETLTGLTNLAAVLLDSGDLEGAEKEVLRALEIQPDYKVALRQLFSVRLRQERYDEAIEASVRVLDTMGAEDSLTAGQIANTYRRAGRTEEGIDVFSRRIEAGQWFLGASLSRLFYDSGDIDSAERVARAVLAQDPTNQEAMVTLFKVSSQRGQLPGLTPLLEQSLEVNPRSVMHLNWLAIVHESTGDMRTAESLLLRALDANPDHGGSMANLGAFYGRHGREAEAITLLERALRINPHNLDARVNLGSALARSGRLDEAVVEFEYAADNGRESPDVYNAIARAYGQQGDLSTAAVWLRRSLELDPGQSEVQSTLDRIEARIQ